MNIEFNEHFDVVVVGAGHAGCEAALASARMGLKTLILTLNLESIAFLACNPAIGGTAKGHLVREIDALGGQMGITSDHTLIQLRMLNSAKGVAVQSLRAQADKNKYHRYMKKVLEEQDNLVIQQGDVKKVIVENGKVTGVETMEGCKYYCEAVVLCTGVYLTSDIIMGKFRKNSGPSGFGPANYLTKNLIDLGFDVRRFKTGTPARVDRRTIDFSKFEIQDAEDGIEPFSFMTDKLEYEKNPCYLGYTNEKTHKIILDNLDKAPMYSGDIKGIGPRYCPSIETKIVRFKDKKRHQIFIEPEGLDTNEMYVQGMSTSFPPEIQTEMYRSIEGLENVRIMRYAYAIEYDCINPLDLYPTLQFKKIQGLYTAGQINGSSGYEEAGAQGLVAGVNAANYCLGKEPLVLTRSNSYIGVLIDDLVTKGTNEPYRMMTSRAEYRLYLRQDNADLRLTEIGRKIGLVNDDRYNKFLKKKEDLKKINKLLLIRMTAKEINKLLFDGENKFEVGMSLKEMINKNLIDIKDLKEKLTEFKDFSLRELNTVQTEIKYEGYLVKQEEQIKKAEKQENKVLPKDIDYLNIKGLRLEARQKLDQIRPLNLGQASRISGVSPADIAVLIVYLQTNKG